MRYHGRLDLEAHPIAAVATVVDSVFDAFGKLALVDYADQDSVTLPISHIGGPAFRATLFAALSRELGVQSPGRYTVELIELAGPGARLRISLVKADAP